MPFRAEQPAQRETLTRQAARRQAVDVLRIAGAIAEYASRAIADGLSPEQARQAALDAADELELVAGRLRRTARTRLDLDPVSARRSAVQLSALGVPQREIAARVGRSKRRVWDYVRGRS